MKKSSLVSAARALLVIGVICFLLNLLSDFYSPRVESREAAQQMVVELGGRADQQPIILFVTSWCGYCHALEQELKAANIEYIAADIEKNAVARRLYLKVTQGRNIGVPQTIVGDQVFAGFNPRSIKQAISRL